MGGIRFTYSIKMAYGRPTLTTLVNVVEDSPVSRRAAELFVQDSLKGLDADGNVIRSYRDGSSGRVGSTWYRFSTTFTSDNKLTLDDVAKIKASVASDIEMRTVEIEFKDIKLRDP